MRQFLRGKYGCLVSICSGVQTAVPPAAADRVCWKVPRGEKHTLWTQTLGLEWAAAGWPRVDGGWTGGGRLLGHVSHSKKTWWQPSEWQERKEKTQKRRRRSRNEGERNECNEPRGIGEGWRRKKNRRLVTVKQRKFLLPRMEKRSPLRWKRRERKVYDNFAICFFSPPRSPLRAINIVTYAKTRVENARKRWSSLLQNHCKAKTTFWSKKWCQDGFRNASDCFKLNRESLILEGLRIETWFSSSPCSHWNLQQANNNNSDDDDDSQLRHSHHHVSSFFN